MLLLYHSHKHISYPIRTIARSAIIAGEVEKEVMRKTEQLYEKCGEKVEEWKNLSFGEQKEAVKKLIKGVMVKEDGIEVHSESEKTFIAMNLKKKGNKCTVVEPEGKTNNALLKAVVRAHLWKRQLEEGKYRSVKELSVKINIGTRRIQQILRLNYLAPKIKEDIVNGRQPSNLRLVDLREIPMLWSEQLEKFYGFNVYKSNKMRALKKGIGKKLDSGLSRHVTEVVIKRYVKVGNAISAHL